MATVIVMLAPRDEATRAALATSLIEAVAEGYRIPTGRVNVYLQEFTPANRFGGAIEVTVMVHALVRPIELKRALVRQVADAVETRLQVRRDQINIILQDTATENSGVGGRLAIDKQTG